MCFLYEMSVFWKIGSECAFLYIPIPIPPSFQNDIPISIPIPPSIQNGIPIPFPIPLFFNDGIPIPIPIPAI